MGSVLLLGSQLGNESPGSYERTRYKYSGERVEMVLIGGEIKDKLWERTVKVRTTGKAAYADCEGLVTLTRLRRLDLKLERG